MTCPVVLARLPPKGLKVDRVGQAAGGRGLHVLKAFSEDFEGGYKAGHVFGSGIRLVIHGQPYAPSSTLPGNERGRDGPESHLADGLEAWRGCPHPHQPREVAFYRPTRIR
jgi:hypothetical protein